MCGLAGYIKFSEKGNQEIVRRMISHLRHRGPDNQSVKVYNLKTACVCFGHARLSIIDLSEDANQPFERNDKSIIFNGEIYNYKEIKKELIEKGCSFKTDSDTEVILASYEAWGLAFLEKLRGMFAFALLDQKKQEVIFCRDRAGVKPFFYYLDEEYFVFGSELKAIVAHPQFRREIDFSSVHQFMDYGYVPGPKSIFKNTKKLQPGTYLSLNLLDKQFKETIYWNIDDHYSKPLFNIDYESAMSQTRDLLIKSCEYRMVSDVPVGIFLSGGYDSSCVAALLQKERTEKLTTFTIAFPDGENEAPYAEKVAKYLGTDHTTFDCTYQEAKSVIPQMPYFFDEPNADISCIPTYLVSKLAHKEVKVALSADGGDEAFGGYENYRRNLQNISTLNRLPFKNVFSSVLDRISSNIADPMISHRALIISKTLNSDRYTQYQTYVKYKQVYPRAYLNSLFQNYQFNSPESYSKDRSGINDLNNIPLLLDFETTLRDLLLVKVDRASMANSLEVREPLLDHKLFEFVARIPAEYKFGKQHLKRILKDIVHQELPKSVMERPKMGFDLPIYSWLKGDLSFLLEDYLSPEKISKFGLFDQSAASKIVKMFKSGQLRYLTMIWRMIVLQMWFDFWMESKASTPVN